MTHKRILVTGGCGFIGSELVTQLTRAGNHVIILDNLVTGRRENLQELADGSFQFIEGDVRNRELLAQLCAGVSVIYHLACLGLRHSIEFPEETHEVNATGTLRLLEAALHADINKFIYVSSSEVYGSARTAPMDENHPTFPTTAYGASKLTGEAYARAFYKTYGLPVVIMRPFNTYGPRCHHEGNSGEVIPRFLLRALAGRSLVVFGDGKQTRDFTFMEDIVRGIILASENEKSVGKTINLGSGKATSIRQLANLIAEVVGVPSFHLINGKERPGDLRRLIADTRLAYEMLEFTPTVPLKEGLKKLLNWYCGLGIPAEKLLEDEILYNWKTEKTEALP